MKKEISEIKSEMIKEAMDIYKEIDLPSSIETLEDCFTFEKDKILLWFNTPDLSTKVLQRSIPS